MNNTKLNKRILDLRSADEVIGEIERLRSGGYRKTKRWNLSQICEHLSMTMVGEMEGLGFRLPWIIRRTFGVWLTNRVLRTRRMPSVPTLLRLVPQSVGSSNNDEIIDACIAAVRRSEVFNGSLTNRFERIKSLMAPRSRCPIHWRTNLSTHSNESKQFLFPKH